MALYEVFSFSVRVRYKGYLCSKTTLFYFFTTVSTLILPLCCIYSEGFWKSVSYFEEQPDVAFKHKFLLLLETRNPDNFIFWSTFKKMNEYIPKKMQRVIPSIEHREEDYNRDGKFDELFMTIEVPLAQQEVLSLKLLLMFDFKLHLYTQFQMEGAAYIHHNSALAGSSYYLNADLKLSQREPLGYSGKDARYNISIIDDSQVDTSFLRLENIFLQYMKRNITTILSNQYPVWKAGHGENSTFVIKLAIQYPLQIVLYKVSPWQITKWFIVQYIAFYAIFSYIFYRLKLYVFKNHLVPSTVLSPIKND